MWKLSYIDLETITTILVPKEQKEDTPKLKGWLAKKVKVKNMTFMNYHN